jgi:AcrR family transcriptional regulator
MAVTSIEHRDNGVARQRVANIQRARILGALVEVCAEQGAAKLTVSEIVARAGISRRTFYELFEDCEQCLLAGLDDAAAKAAARVVEAYEAHTRWRERLRAGLGALLSFLEEQPEIGRLLIVESLGAGSKALERRSRVLVPVIAAVDAGVAESKSGTALPSLTAEGVVGGVLAVIHRRMLEPRGWLVELTNPLMSMIVLPYLGTAAARREAERPAPAASRAAVPTGKPLSKLGMRVTYRTMRVLAAIEAQPGASNRQVGRVAGIEDQGQVSKLLARIKRLGLVENVGEDSGKGAPNAWELTAKGSEFQAAIEPHSGMSGP